MAHSSNATLVDIASKSLFEGLLARFALGARTERETFRRHGRRPFTLEARGWGRLLQAIAPHPDVPTSEQAVQIGTFGTCDALFSIRRLIRLSELLYARNEFQYHPKLDEIVIEAEAFLLAALDDHLCILARNEEHPVSAPRCAHLVAACADQLAKTPALLARVLGCVETAAVRPRSQEPALGWPWFLDSSWSDRRPLAVPTALLVSALISVEACLPKSVAPEHKALCQRLISEGAEFLCDVAESPSEPDISETTVVFRCLTGLQRRPRNPTKLDRRVRKGKARLFLLLQELATVLTASLSKTRLRTLCPAEPREDDAVKQLRLKDFGFDVFPAGTVIEALLDGNQPDQGQGAWVALAQSFKELDAQVRDSAPISTEWVASVLSGYPEKPWKVTKERIELLPHRRYVPISGHRAMFLVISDTQFGYDSLTNKPPGMGTAADFAEVSPLPFDTLLHKSAEEFSSRPMESQPWSGLLHLGDVVCKGHYFAEQSRILENLRSAAAKLRLPKESIVLTPGNHDFVRPEFLATIRKLLEKKRKATFPFEEALSILQREAGDALVPQKAFAAFHDTYGQLIGKRVRMHPYGVEIVTVLGPLLKINFIVLWPVCRFKARVPKLEKSKTWTHEQYGLDPRVRQIVHQFLVDETDPSDVNIVLSHVPCSDAMSSWNVKKETDAWVGSPGAIDLKDFVKFVEAPVSDGRNTTPRIHLLLSGHMQNIPRSELVQDGPWSYIAGAFHIRREISKGPFAARLMVEEGVIRLDSIGLDPEAKASLASAGNPPLPLIVALETEKVSRRSYNAHVLESYSREAPDFIRNTDVPTKFPQLERAREAFVTAVTKKFPTTSNLRILDVGAGAGRDLKHFLNQGFTVTALEGASDLAKHLRELATSHENLAVEEVNFLVRKDLEARLGTSMFHGIWACSCLLHVPGPGDSLDWEPHELHCDASLVQYLAGKLLPGGVMYIDNKLGYGSHFKERGNVFGKRWFRYRTLPELKKLLSGAGLKKVTAGWHDAVNGFDAWGWAIGHQQPRFRLRLTP